MKTTEVSDLITEVNNQEVFTWEEVKKMLAEAKQSSKKTKSSVSKDPAEKLRILKEKWAESCPLGSKILGEEVSFLAFGSEEIKVGLAKSIVLDKRVNMYLIQIECDGKIYHKDSKCINITLFKHDNGKLIKV